MSEIHYSNYPNCRAAIRDARHQSHWTDQVVVVVSHGDKSYSAIRADMVTRAIEYLPGQIIDRFKAGKRVKS